MNTNWKVHSYSPHIHVWQFSTYMYSFHHIDISFWTVIQKLPCGKKETGGGKQHESIAWADTVKEFVLTVVSLLPQGSFSNKYYRVVGLIQLEVYLKVIFSNNISPLVIRKRFGDEMTPNFWFTPVSCLWRKARWALLLQPHLLEGVSLERGAPVPTLAS